MDGRTLAALSSLPIQTYPGYSVRTAIGEAVKSAITLQKALEPSFFRRLLGGITKDYARSICAISNEQIRVVRGIVGQVAQVAMAAEGRTNGVELQKWKAISGTCRRIIDKLDEWRSLALDFEANTIGSHAALVTENKRLMHFLRDLEHPAAGLQ
jgi:hypothetical protein